MTQLTNHQSADSIPPSEAETDEVESDSVEVHPTQTHHGEMGEEGAVPAPDPSYHSDQLAFETGRLENYFGKEQWPQMKSALRQWGEAHLTPTLYRELSGHYDGVLLIHRMMHAAHEGTILDRSADNSGDMNEETLRKMIRDPRYWREQNPAFHARVAAGYRRLYPE